jgi:hypothetical protein
MPGVFGLTDRCKMKDSKLQTNIRRVIQALPLAAILGASLLPIQPIMRHLLVAATLIWLQIVIVVEVFQVGK